MPKSPPEPAPAGTRKLRVRHDHGRPKYMYDSSHRWSDEAEETFLDALAASCNIEHAAAACGFSQAALHARKRRHPAFALKWKAALDQGFLRLEAELLRAAVDTLAGVEFDADRPMPRMTIAEAMNLYRIHASSVGRAGPRWGTRAPIRSMGELRDGIVRKLDAVRRAHGLPPLALPAPGSPRPSPAGEPVPPAEDAPRVIRFSDLVAGFDGAALQAGFANLSEEELIATLGSWPDWAHDGQEEPPGDWRTWVIMAGRGFGKTRAGAEWIAAAARADGDLRVALVAASFDEARAVMVEGQSGLLAVAPDDIADWSAYQRLLRFTSGAEARLYSGACPEKLRGPEHHLAWCDELAKWKQGVAAWDNLQLGLRLGARPRALVTTTPRPCEALKRILAKPHVLTGGATSANPHLPDAFTEAVTALYAGTRLARQELAGELLPDVAGALWSVELLERCRASPSPSWGESRGEGRERQRASWDSTPLSQPSPQRGDGLAPFARTVIGVDPPAGDGTCGIVACAKDEAGIGHVLADHSVTARSPESWARAVAAAAEAHGASLVVAEANQGGKMVEAVLRAANVPARVKLVHAAQGKSARADPVAALFEAGRVRLHGRFVELEAELCGLVGGGGYEGPGSSPDRADAMVWALTELMLGMGLNAPQIRRL